MRFTTKMSKPIVGLVLVVAMLAGLAAAAAGGKYITLIDNAEETELLLTDGITLDLNGFILTTEAFRAYLGDDLSGFLVDSKLRSSWKSGTASHAVP